jgi:hypothetical protein
MVHHKSIIVNPKAVKFVCIPLRRSYTGAVHESSVKVLSGPVNESSVKVLSGPVNETSVKALSGPLKESSVTALTDAVNRRMIRRRRN